MSNPDDYPQTAETVRAAIEASNAERRRINAQIGKPAIPLHPEPEFHPVNADAHQRLRDFRLDERCGVDTVAQAISRHLYGRSYDDLPASVRVRVEGAALRAVRSPQGAWMAEALKRAHLNLDRAMAQEMGPIYQMQAPAARQAQVRIAVQIVVSALLSVLEVEFPFSGAGEALPVYVAADAAAREVK